MNLNLNFKRKIVITGSIVIALTLITSVFSILGVRTMESASQALRASNERVSLYQKLFEALAGFESGMKGYMLTGDDAYLEPYSAAEAQFNDLIRRAIELADQAEYKNRLNQVIESKDRWIRESSIPQMMAKKKLDRGIILSDEFVKIIKSFNDLATFTDIRSQLHSLKEIEDLNFARELTLVQSIAEKSVWSTIVSLLGFFLGLAAVFWLTLRTSKSVELILGSLKEITSTVRNQINTLRQNASELRSATEQQNQEIQTTASAATELSSMVSENRKTVSSTLSVTDSGSNLAKAGSKIGGDLNTAVGTLNASFLQELAELRVSFEQVETFAGRISSIREKTKSIFDIVFQTRLLSFNASVEAARAGESGKGFSVVAEEIGNLARMSGTIANEIEREVSTAVESIGLVLTSNKNSISAMETNVTGVLKTVEGQSEETLQSFRTFEDISEKLRSAFNSIDGASSEQTSGVNSIEKTILELSSVSEKTAMASKQAIEVVAVLNQSLETLSADISKLNAEFIGDQKVSVRPEESLPDNSRIRIKKAA